MRYRLFHFKEIAGQDVWKEVGTAAGDDPEEALRGYTAVAGRWLVLEVEGERFHEMLVKHRTETDIEPVRTVRV